MIYKFKKPFKFGNETNETVELKEELNTGDMIRITNAEGTGDKMGAMLVAATGWPLPKVAQISIPDSIAISEIVTPFFGFGEAESLET